MLPVVRLESVGDGIDAEFARALPVVKSFDLGRPAESLLDCMRYGDTAFLLDLTEANPLGWRYRAQSGLERLKGAALPVRRLGEQPDPRFTRDVLIPTYLEVIAADQPVVHRIAAVANYTLLAYRKLTIPLHAERRSRRASHILTLTRVDLAMPDFHSRGVDDCRMTSRERQCLSLAASGLMGKQIAAGIGISEKTVELHLARARSKLGARTTAQAVAMTVAMAVLDR